MGQETKEAPVGLMGVFEELRQEERQEWSYAQRAAEEMVRRTIEAGKKIDVLDLRDNFRKEHPKVQPKYINLAFEYAFKSLDIDRHRL